MCKVILEIKNDYNLKNIFVISLDLNLCMLNLPTFINICVTELWHSDIADINSASTSALKVRFTLKYYYL